MGGGREVEMAEAAGSGADMASVRREEKALEDAGGWDEDGS